MLRNTLNRNQRALKSLLIKANNASQLPEDASIKDNIMNSNIFESNSISNTPAFDSILETLPKEEEDNRNNDIEETTNDILTSSTSHV